MNLLKILDIKTAMSHILLKISFDEFYLEEAEVTTFAKMSINGKRNLEWYDDNKNLSKLLKWKEVKDILFQYIKGKQTPSVMKISLKADDSMKYIIMKDTGYYEKLKEYNPDLFIQIRYENKALCFVTGIAYNEFIMDKVIEKAWDNAVQNWVKSLKISYELNL